MKAHIYRQLIEDSPIPYVLIKLIRKANIEDGQIEILDINKSFKNVFKLTKEEAIKIDLKKYLGTKDYNVFLSRLHMADCNKYNAYKYNVSENESFDIEIYNFEKDEYHIRATKINRYSNKLSSIIRQYPFAAWIKNRDGKYIEVNEQYLRIFNFEYNDIVGKYPEEVWDSEDARIFNEQHRYVMQGDKVDRQQHTFKISKYKNCYFETIRWPYTDETGNAILGTMGVTIEITDKIRLREAIEKNERNFFDMANNIDELIVIRDEKKALYISPYFEKLYGFKPDALYEDVDKWYQHWDSIEFLEEPHGYDYNGIDTGVFRVVKHGGIDKWIQSKFIPIFDEHGNILRKIGILRDITAKKKIEEEMECLRMEFFANISHELRTPINIIMTALQMMDLKIEQLDQEGAEELSKYLGIIAQNGRRLMKLVNNLIDTTKINSGNFEYRPTNQNIVSFVEDICTSVVDFVERNKLEIIFDTDVEEKLIGFDINQMERIILNLLSNAIKFNQENGKIEVTIYTEDQIRISIKDDGIGIPEDKLEGIFRRFEQVDKRFKREKEGSGIGLALVKSLVEMHGGTIQVVSTLGQGSEFIITLPDLLVPEQAEEIDKASYYIGQVHKAEVELSDIYC